MEIVLLILGILLLIIAITVIAFFSMPGWHGPNHTPDNETVRILSVIGIIIVVLIAGAVLWENFL